MLVATDTKEEMLTSILGVKNELKKYQLDLVKINSNQKDIFSKMHENNRFDKEIYKC
jgi:DNA polymerase III delta prime subunit